MRAKSFHSFHTNTIYIINMLNWLKSGKLSSGTSCDKVVSHEGGEGPRESEDLEATETERIEKENERESEDAPAETEEEGRRWQKRGDESEHQTGKKRRKYDDNYLGLGFTWIGDTDCPKPQCVLCSEVLANSCLKPSYLCRHLHTKHGNLSQKPLLFFKAKLEELQKSQKKMQFHSCVGSTKDALRASYLLSYRVGRKGLPHTIAEDVCLPAAKEMVECMIGEKEAKKLDMIPVSNNTVSRRIDAMAEDILATLVSRVKKSEFYSLQVDESTDVANLANLLLYVRYHFEGTVQEDFLFCRPLATRTTGQEISWLHCSIHREALAAKNMPADLLAVLNDAVKLVNFIKARPLNSRIFTLLCNEMGSEHKSLLLHTEVRWLSRGKVLTRLFELRHELQQFFEENPFHLASSMHDEDFLKRLAYLADIFSALNELNLSLQGVSVTVFNTQDRIEAMIKKLRFWASCVSGNTHPCFPTLHEFLGENDMDLGEHVKSLIIEHLNQLAEQLRKHFPPMDTFRAWIRNPFEVSLPVPQLSFHEQEQLIELSSDGALQLQFKRKPLVDFWTESLKSYTVLAKQALRVLMPFATTYLCEAGFSAMAAVKTKHRQRLDAVEKELRLKLSSIAPNFGELCAKMQAHPSH
ncbi:zinc finger BED domain-containing protein 5-like [Rhinichthys klamathensis goyatoka]|uniref:zinc finger BED domain-containing protein 5-like n=1 Tax=Rhinichthys klamathensis goyatoka TaxID=3034132 RepID=UPI0024B510E6|nr:zinc finger BED domain-containing protein 5-like [Rhinichthys klamathensis goyatoka]